jgi:peptidoglycan hydrolase CwlO-like protein
MSTTEEQIKLLKSIQEDNEYEMKSLDNQIMFVEGGIEDCQNQMIIYQNQISDYKKQIETLNQANVELNEIIAKLLEDENISNIKLKGKRNE